MNDNIVLSVRDLEVNFYNNERCNRVLRGVSFQLQKGKIMCIVGESGCGKSVTANSIMGLLPDLSRIEKGEIHFFHNGRDIRIDQLKRKGKEMRQIRGDGISMIFQDPMTALNPVFTVGYQINESLLYHDRAKTKSEAKQKAIRLLKDMGIPLPEKRVDEYPYQFSGGMCQRAMIAAMEKGGFRAPGTFEDLRRLIQGYLGEGNKMGEGWLLTAEMLELIHSGTPNIVCTQPFGCLPNHIVGKGMIRKLKDDYPFSNIVAIDYDPGATKINQENRIKLMLANARGLAKQEAERREAGEAAHV